jgi:WD40 repeat protein
LLGYEILREVGRGGMGVVFEARQLALGRVVALKLILAGAHAGEDARGRFRAEAESIARLQHPHVVQIHEVGKQDGWDFYAMEWVEGGSLAARLDGTPWPANKAAALVEKLARAMHAVHQEGVIHRDLKPGNVLLTSAGEPKIADFGLARRLDVDQGQTKTGAIVGTPSYLPPEQAAGRSEALSPRSDVYSLGAVLYELLTGRPPFKGQTPLDTLLQVRCDEPVPPSRLVPKCPRDLETICLKCLQKEPPRRYPTALALAEDLERFLNGAPISARPVGRPERVWRWARRNPSMAGLAAAVVVSLLAGTAAAWYLALDALEEKRRADDKTAEAWTNAARADANSRTANENLRQAIEEKNRADDAAADAWSHLYVTRMNLMQTAWEKQQVAQVLDLLALCRKPPAGIKDARGWEYYFQERLCHPELRTLTGHTDEVYRVAYSPDGRRLATASQDATVKIWDTATGGLLRTLPGAARVGFWGLAFSPDGTRLAASDQFTVRVWDAASGVNLVTIKTLPEAGTPFSSNLAFSADGKALACGSLRTVNVWDAATGKLRRTFEHKPGADVMDVRFSPDGKTLASASNKDVILWDLSSGRAVRTFSGVEKVRFSPDGRWLATSADRLFVVHVHDLLTGRMRSFSGMELGGFSPDGKILTTIDQNPIRVTLWDAVTGAKLRALDGHSGRIYDVTFRPDGRHLATASGDRTVRIWDVSVDHETRAFEHPLGNRTPQELLRMPWDVAFTPDGAQLALRGGPRITLLDTTTGQPVRIFEAPLKWFSCLAISRDGARLAAGAYRPRDQDGKGSQELGDVHVWGLKTGELQHILKGHPYRVSGVAFSPDGKQLFSVSQRGHPHETGEVRVWDLSTGQQVRYLAGARSPASRYRRLTTELAMAVSHDGRLLALGGWDDTTEVHDLHGGQVLQTLKHDELVNCMAFSPDGSRLVTGESDGNIRLWDLASRQILHTFKGYTGDRSVAFHSNGARIVTGGATTVKVWDVATGQQVRTFPGSYSAVAFSPEGWRLAYTIPGKCLLLDARPLTSAVKAQREALGLVTYLFALPLPKQDVLAVIHSDQTISEEVRTLALAFAERYQPQRDAKGYVDAAWRLVSQDYLDAYYYRLALIQAKEAQVLSPADARVLTTFSLAQFRVGRRDDALQTLSRAEKLTEEIPGHLAPLAIAQHRMGQKARAHATWSRLQTIAADPKWARDERAQNLLQEVQTLISPK